MFGISLIYLLFGTLIRLSLLNVEEFAALHYSQTQLGDERCYCSNFACFFGGGVGGLFGWKDTRLFCFLAFGVRVVLVFIC